MIFQQYFLGQICEFWEAQWPHWRYTGSCLGNSLVQNRWQAIIQFNYDWVQVSLTQWGRDIMAVNFLTIFSNAFSWMKIYKFRLRFHWSLFPRVQWTIFQHWFRLGLGAGQVTSHYLNQWWLVNWRIYASLGLNELLQGHSLKNIALIKSLLNNTLLTLHIFINTQCIDEGVKCL